MVKSFRKLCIRYPLRIYLILLILTSWLILGFLSLNSLPTEPGLLLITYIGLLGLAVLITYWSHGKSGVKKLLRGVFHWRLSVIYYVFALLVFPITTIIIAAITGTLEVTPEAITPTLISYGLSLISLTLLINLWEETGWTGFVQAKLMKKLGLLKGSLLTAPLFSAIHLPLLLGIGTTQELLISLAALFGTSFFFRYLIGMLFIESSGSLLIIGLLHASFNSTNSLEIVHGEIELVIAAIIITALFALYRKIRGRVII